MKSAIRARSSARFRKWKIRFLWLASIKSAPRDDPTLLSFEPYHKLIRVIEKPLDKIFLFNGVLFRVPIL